MRCCSGVLFGGAALRQINNFQLIEFFFLSQVIVMTDEDSHILSAEVRM